ncbi:acyltransferase [Candidatus Microgenomates bacterium]|nr:acyltransferase [Candidatus Microgenomates bacterium]
MERREEIDVLKALAIIGVVGIHFGSYFFPLYIPFSPLWSRQVVIDQIWRFSVPMFVALSGYTLAWRYKDTTLNLGEFFRRRVLRILPLYLLWAGVSFFLGQTGYPFWQAILLGRADYHLYFVPMIIQLYIFFPIFLWLIKKWPPVTVAAALGLQVWLFSLYGRGQWSDQAQYLFAGTWLFYFVFGIYGAVAKIRGGILWLIIWLGGLWLVVNDTFNLLKLPTDLIVATRFTKFSVLIYATGTIGVGLIWGKFLLFVPYFLRRFLVFVGQQSFLIYLSHVLILQIFFAMTRSALYPGNAFLTAPSVVLALIASLVLAKLL